MCPAHPHRCCRRGGGEDILGSIGGISWGYLGRTQVRCQLVTHALFCLTSFFLFILDAIGRFRRPALWYYACAAVFDHWKFWPSCSCLRRALRAISDHVQDYAAQIYLRTTEIMQNLWKTVDFEKGITKRRPIVLETESQKPKFVHLSANEGVHMDGCRCCLSW